MLFHKQQFTDGQLLYSVVSSKLSTSTILIAHQMHVNSVHDMIRKDRRLAIEHVA